jgi:hypothetical protein
MHPAALQLTKTIHSEFLCEKGYRLAAGKLRYEFPGGRVISCLRGCSKWNRNNTLPWSFQIDSKIVFDDLNYDPKRSPPKPGPRGSISEGLYEIKPDVDVKLAEKLACVICTRTEKFIARRDIFHKHFQHLLKERRNGNEGQVIHTPRKLSSAEKAEIEQWLAKQAKKALRK